MTPAFLGLIHRDVRVLDERPRIQAVLRVDAHTDACRDAKLMLVDGMNLGYCLQHFLRGNASVFRSLHFGKQHDKFIAALPAHRIRAAYARDKPIGDRLKKLVADRMSERIVDLKPSKSRNSTATLSL
jgi:hypothetical protein